MTTSVKHRWGIADLPRQDGRTVVVTGANSGLGLVTTRELARAGARVVMAVRSEEKGRRARDAVRAAVPAADLTLKVVDLADLHSVREFAESFAASFPDEIDVLINNAGVMMPPRSLTPQGHESQFAANHLGHFALTGLLLPRIRRDGAARVVTVTSALHRGGRIDFDDLTGERGYSPARFYSQSKFANVLFGLELERRLRAGGLPIRSVLAHPGYANTNLQKAGPSGITNLVLRLGNALFAQSAEQGALSQLYAATDPDAEGGQFIGPDRMREYRGHPSIVQPDPAAADPALARRLWTVSERLTGVSYLD
jgi:NAD(P)-dependent dehydrogenase (short-subunit alcohol dehydrogenase family)